MTYRLSKTVITNAQNNNLVNATAKAQKQKKKVTRANRRAHVKNKE
jgi:hypothetical protein